MTKEEPRIGIVSATEQGSTPDIAEFISSELAGCDATVELADFDPAPDLSSFDTVLPGSIGFLSAATDNGHAYRLPGGRHSGACATWPRPARGRTPSPRVCGCRGPASQRSTRDGRTGFSSPKD